MKPFSQTCSRILAIKSNTMRKNERENTKRITKMKREREREMGDIKRHKIHDFSLFFLQLPWNHEYLGNEHTCSPVKWSKHNSNITRVKQIHKYTNTQECPVPLSLRSCPTMRNFHLNLAKSQTNFVI